jgi:hypothetical protein
LPGFRLRRRSGTNQESKENVEKSGVGNLVAIEQRISSLDLSKANVVTLYLLLSERKLIPQLKACRSRIVSMI